MINVAVCPKCILVHSNIWGVFSCTPNKSPWMSQNDRVLFASFVFQSRTHPATKAARNALQNSRILKSSQNEEWRMTEKADVFTAQTWVEYQEHVKLYWNYYHRLHPTLSNVWTCCYASSQTFVGKAARQHRTERFVCAFCGLPMLASRITMHKWLRDFVEPKIRLVRQSRETSLNMKIFAFAEKLSILSDSTSWGASSSEALPVTWSHAGYKLVWAPRDWVANILQLFLVVSVCSQGHLFALKDSKSFKQVCIHCSFQLRSMQVCKRSIRNGILPFPCACFGYWAAPKWIVFPEESNEV